MMELSFSCTVKALLPRTVQTNSSLRQIKETRPARYSMQLYLSDYEGNHACSSCLLRKRTHVALVTDSAKIFKNQCVSLLIDRHGAAAQSVAQVMLISIRMRENCPFPNFQSHFLMLSADGYLSGVLST